MRLAFSPLILLVIALCSCPSRSGISPFEDGNWVQRGEIRGIARSYAASFVIDDIVYLGTGYNENTQGYRLKDFWKFSIDSGWQQVADFPGPPRSNAVGFSIDGYGYLGTGYDGTNLYNDFYQYNPYADQWQRKSDFIGSSRFDAVGFSIQGKGYIATGYDYFWLNDNYRYDPVKDSWVNAISYSGNKRRGALVFAHNNLAYLVAGSNASGMVHDFWRYDPNQDAADQWVRLRDISNTNTDTYDDGYADIIREFGVAFVLGSNAFISLGRNGGFSLSTWAYDFEKDLWSRRSAWERTARMGALAWVINSRAFVCTGTDGNNTLDDCEEFIPDQPHNPND